MNIAAAPAQAPTDSTDYRNLEAPIYKWAATPKGGFTISGSEASLPEHIAEFQRTLRDFAINVMRPIGAKLDKMTPEEVIAPESPLWDFRKQYLELGVTVEALSELPPREAALLFSILFEEMGYGDAGLAISTGAGILPQWLSAKFGRADLLEEFPDATLGCWAITEPDHGSDMLDPNGTASSPVGNYGRPNLVADLTGDDIVLNGQKAAWVSNGVIAEVCIVYCAADVGEGPDHNNGCVIVFPMNLPGISRGKPLDKLGQRALNQGEIFFDNVKIPRKYLLAGPEDYQRAVYCIHAEAIASGRGLSTRLCTRT